MISKIKIGTRGSRLALWQAYHVRDLLLKNKVESEIVMIETKGDKILDVSLSKIGSKGLFTEEIEQKLISKEIDIAVHSAKDVQSVLPEELALIAFTKRELAHDVVVSFDPNCDIFSRDATLVIGTSSTRRVAMMKKYFPHVQLVDMRGNLQTRFQKLKSGVCHGMLLAYAGVHRMGLEQHIVSNLALNLFIPPVGQGSVAIEASKELSMQVVETIRKAVNDPVTEVCLLAERAFLKTMNGGCSIPTFAHAAVQSNTFTISGGIISLDGIEITKKALNFTAGNPSEAGEQLAKLVLLDGGKSILENIKNNK